MKTSPKIITGLSFCLLALLAVPCIALVTGWQWKGGAQSPLLGFFYFSTETVSYPMGVISSGLMLAGILWLLQPTKARLWKCTLLLITPIALGQVTVSVLKKAVQEPRPYVMWLNHGQTDAVSQFYSMDAAQRGVSVLGALRDDHLIPHWQKEHWAKESTWSFPSGHSIFAAAWAMLGVGVLWPRKRFITSVILTTWAVSVLVSRLILGMHWPVDLIASIVLAFILTSPSIVAINKYYPQITKKEQ